MSIPEGKSRNPLTQKFPTGRPKTIPNKHQLHPGKPGKVKDRLINVSGSGITGLQVPIENHKGLKIKEIATFHIFAPSLDLDSRLISTALSAMITVIVSPSLLKPTFINFLLKAGFLSVPASFVSIEYGRSIMMV